ncbi:MAG: hypothetical protein ABIJ57_00075, partial [Pseudomonadota bacterium]
FLGDLWDQFATDKPAERAKAANAIAISETYNIPPSVAYEHMDEISQKVGLRDQPTFREMIEKPIMGAVVAGLFTHPLATVIGVTAFAGLAEVENYLVSKSQRRPYQFGAGRGLAEMLPDDTERGFKDLVWTADMAWKVVAAGGAIKASRPAAEQFAMKFMRDVTEKYNLPRSVFISPEKIREFHGLGREDIITPEEAGILKDMGLTRQQYIDGLKYGLDLEIPGEKLVTIVDKPWWAAMKQFFRASPYEKMVVTSPEGGARKHVTGLLEEPVTGKPPEVAGKVKEQAPGETLPTGQGKVVEGEIVQPGANKYGYADTPYTRIFGFSDRGGSVLGDIVHHDYKGRMILLKKELGAEKAKRFNDLWEKRDAETAEREFPEYSGKGAETLEAQRKAAVESIKWKEIVQPEATIKVKEERPEWAVGGENIFYHGSWVEIDRWGIVDSTDLGVHFGTKEQAINRVQKGGRGSGTLNITQINIPEDKIIDVPDIFNRIGWPSGSPYADIVRIFDGRVNFKWDDKSDLLERARKADDLVDLDTGRGDWNDEVPVRIFWQRLRKKLLEYGYEAVSYENKVEGGGESLVVLNPRKTKIKKLGIEDIPSLPEEPSPIRRWAPEPEYNGPLGIPKGIKGVNKLEPGKFYTFYEEGYKPQNILARNDLEATALFSSLSKRGIIAESFPKPSRPPEGEGIKEERPEWMGPPLSVRDQLAAVHKLTAEEAKRFPKIYEKEPAPYVEPDPPRLKAPKGNAKIIAAVSDKPWEWTADDLVDLKPSEKKAKLEKIWGPEEEFDAWWEGEEPGPRRHQVSINDDLAADLDTAVKNGYKADIENVLGEIHKRLDPWDYYAYEEIQNAGRGPVRPVAGAPGGAGEISAPEGAGAPAVVAGKDISGVPERKGGVGKEEYIYPEAIGGQARLFEKGKEYASDDVNLLLDMAARTDQAAGPAPTTEYDKIRAEAARIAYEKTSKKIDLKKRREARALERQGMEEARQDPVFLAMEYAIKQGGLNRDKLLRIWDKETINELAKKRIGLVTKEGKLGLDEVATDHGFVSDDALMNMMLDWKGLGEVGKKAAAEFEERYSDLMSEAEKEDFHLSLLEEEAKILRQM